MEVGGAQLDDRRSVLGGRVADVLVEAEAWIGVRDSAHVAVAGDLRDHRGGCDRPRVAVDHRPVLDPAATPERKAIAEADGARDCDPVETAGEAR